MSYEVRLTIDTGSEHDTVLCNIGNYPEQVKPYLDVALSPSGLEGLNGLLGSACITPLRAGLTDMRNRPGVYRAINPSSRFVNYDGAMDYLTKILECCVEHPLATVRVRS